MATTSRPTTTQTTGKAQAAGTVKAAHGEVVAINASGESCTLKPGDKVYPNDIIQTNDGGSVQIEFTNGQVADLGRQASMLVSEDLFKPNEAQKDDIARIQELIAQGADPTKVTEASAAGGPEDASGHQFVQVDYGSKATVASGLDLGGTGTNNLTTETNKVGVTGENITSGVQVGYNTTGQGSSTQQTPPPTPPEDQKKSNDTTSGDGAQAEAENQTVEASEDDNAVAGQLDKTIPAEGTQSGEYGTLTVHTDGSWSYDLNESAQELKDGEQVTDTFTVPASDGTVSQITIDITGTNDAPTVEAQTASATEGGSTVSVSALTGAGDADSGATLSVVDVPNNLPAGVSFADGKFSIDPSNAAYNDLAEGATRTVSVSYGVSDGDTTTPNTVTFTVTGTNDGPVAIADTATTDEDRAVTINVLANDSDVDGGTLSVTSASSDQGTVVLNRDGTVTFTPTKDFNGDATIRYEISDGQGGTSSSSVSVKVTAVDDEPPAPPVITNIVDHNGDYSSVTLYGTGEAGATVTLFGREGSTTNGNDTGSWNYVKEATAVVDANGQWSVNISNLSNTPINDNEFFKATQTDSANNVSDFSNTAHYWHGTWSSAATEAGDDYDMMGSGNDSIAIVSDDANNRLVVDGGMGTDTASFSMNHTDIASVVKNASGEIIITEKNGDIDVLRNVEVVQFNDGAYKLDDGHLYFDFGGDGDKHDNDGNRNNGIGNGVQDAPGNSINTHGDEVDGSYTIRAGTNGNDQMTGGTGDDFLSGGKGNDTLFGGSGNDLLIGGKGDDVLVGGQGSNVLTGSDGADTFKFGAGDLDGKVDVITDFTVAATGGDVLDLHDLLGGGATLSFSDVKTDDKGNTTVSVNIDADGAGSQSAVQLATITLQGVSSTDPSAIMKQLLDNHELKI